MIRKRVNIRLKDGINLVIVKPVWEYPITRGVLMLHTGAYIDPPDKKGLSTVFFALLTERPNLLEKMETFGARINASVSLAKGFISFAFLNSSLKRSFSLLTKFIDDFVVNQDLLRIVKEKKKDRLSIMEDDPQYLIAQRVQNIVYSNSSLSNPISGSRNGITKIGVKDIEDYYLREFLGAHLDIIIVSTASYNRIQRMVEDFVEKFNPRGVKIPDIPARYTPKKVIIRKKNVKNVFINYFVPVGGIGTDEYLPLKMISYVLGEGSFNSRLVKRLREELGLVYYISSDISKGVVVNGKRYDGYFEIIAETSKREERRLVMEIDESLRNIFENGISEKELEIAKKYYIGIERKRGETYKDILRTILAERIFSLKENFFMDAVKYVERIRMEDVERVRHRLDPLQFSTILLKEDGDE